LQHHSVKLFLIQLPETMAFVASLLFFFVTTVAYCNAVVTVEEHRILFERRENELDWPLPDNTDPGALIIHGIHCFEKLQEPIDPNHRNISAMHREHCGGIISNILNFLETNPSYNVNEWICKTLSNDRLLRSPKAGIFNYGNCYWHSCNGRTKRSNNNVQIKRGKQNDIYGQIASFNMGNLLMKNWTDPQSLNGSERIYLQRWESRSATAFGALGIYCRVKGDLDSIRQTLN